MAATIRVVLALAFTVLLVSEAALFAQAPGQPQQPEFVRQGQQLMRDGKMEEALALYRQTLQTSPNSLGANIAAGTVFDLMGRGEEARKYFEKAIDRADTPEHKAMAQRAMAVSYAFEARSCFEINEYERKVFDYYASVKNFYQQGRLQTRQVISAWTPTTCTADTPAMTWIPPTTGISLGTTRG